MLRTLSTDKAVDVLEEMPSDEAADALDGLDENKAEELLNNMEKEASDEIRELMQYKEYLVGSLMNTDFISCPSDYTVGDVINDICQSTEEIDEFYYVYVVSDINKLVGSISLKDLIVSNSDKKLENIMNKEVIYIKDIDKINDLVKSIIKYNLFAIPVVDEQMRLIGNVSINDVLYEVTKYNKKYK